jgi:anti-sigma-K factor RskA
MTGPHDSDLDDGAGGDAVRAAEYALRLMDPSEVPAFEVRLADDPVLRRLVADWQAGLAPLMDEVPAVPPPDHLRDRILSVVAPGPAPLAARPRRRAGSWLGWIGGLAGAGAVALMLLVVLPQVSVPTEGAAFTAEIAADDGSLVLRAALSDGQLTVERLSGSAPAGRVLELWLIAEGAPAPVSLGVLPPDAATVLAVPDAAAFAGGVLAVSEEPPGGSPTGAPTGAVLAAGAITTL